MDDESESVGDGPAEAVSFSMEITNGRTEIRVSGDRDTAVILRSESGEKIYLPPEDFDRPPETQTAYDSPYQTRSGAQESPYQTGRDPATVTGMEPTANGYLIVHPEPVTDTRFLR